MSRLNLGVDATLAVLDAMDRSDVARLGRLLDELGRPEYLDHPDPTERRWYRETYTQAAAAYSELAS